MHKLLLLVLMTGCAGIPHGVEAVKNFDLKRYLGTWHEIARLDHRFERGLDKISATYSLRDDGGINVINQGLNKASGEWSKAEGKAYFVEQQTTGRLKVSFFWPFYSGYNIIALDEQHYAYAMIAGTDKDYLWILSRTPKLSPVVLRHLVDEAKARGFATDKLIYVNQST
jgi:apolipoprotein D and lipocalin family protein